jgi:putative transposase
VVAESFSATFKKRMRRKKIYSTRDEGKTEIFNFIELFYNPKIRHSHAGGVSPNKFEEAYFFGTTDCLVNAGKFIQVKKQLKSSIKSIKNY